MSSISTSSSSVPSKLYASARRLQSNDFLNERTSYSNIVILSNKRHTYLLIPENSIVPDGLTLACNFLALLLSGSLKLIFILGFEGTYAAIFELNCIAQTYLHSILVSIYLYSIKLTKRRDECETNITDVIQTFTIHK